MTTDEFLEIWHKAVDERDMDLMASLVDPKATIASPAFWSPKGDKAYVMTILTAVGAAFEEFTYIKEWIDGGELMLEFSARVEDVQLKGIDRISLNDEGLLTHIEVMIRPMNALFKLAEHVQEAFAE